MKRDRKEGREGCRGAASDREECKAEWSGDGEW